MTENSSYYTISNVSEKLKIPPHVLRFWEKKFNFVKPKKSQTGRRYYSNQDIVNLEIIKRNKEHLTFSFDLQIKDLKNFTNLISQIKQSNLRFKIIRHKQKKNAFIRRIFENFKRN